LQESVARSRERGDLFQLIEDIMRVAGAHTMLGNLDEARRAAEEALDLAQRDDVDVGIAAALYTMSSLDSAEGRHERAVRLTGAATAINESIGSAQQPSILFHLLGDPTAAAREAIGDEATDQGLAEGRAMTQEEAVAYARKDET